MNNKILPTEFDGHDLTNYANFLRECLQKDYSGQGTQKHHILSPKFMGGTDDECNLITLNYQDHYTAHLILAECFPKGNINRGKNYGAAKLIVGYVKQHLKKRYGDDISIHWEGFWEIAHREVCELNRGENHPMFGDKYSPERCLEMSEQRKGKRMGSENTFFGKTHTEESRRKIKEARANQVFSEETKIKQIAALISNNKSGAENKNFGKTWEEIHGEEKAAAMKIKLGASISDYYARLRAELPDGIFECDVVINGSHKTYYRYCPEEGCGNIIYRGSKNSKPTVAIAAHNKKNKCSECAAQVRCGGLVFYDSKTTKPPVNNIVIFDNLTGITYNSIMNARKSLNIGISKYNKMIDSNRLQIVENNSHWNKEP